MRNRCVIAALLLASSPAICAAGVGKIHPTELAGGELVNYPFFANVQSFGPTDRVFVAVDPTRFPALVGVTVDIYLVASRTAAEWEIDTTLVDVRVQGEDTVSLSGSTIQDNTFIVAATTELPSQAAIGMGIGYDVVIDVGRDGFLSDGDLIDGLGTSPGFYAVPDTTQPGPLSVSTIEYNGGTWLTQRTFYPTNIDLLGQIPLIVVSHGWTHLYTFYDHIGEHLASYGYIVTSHSNDVGNGGPTATETASTTTISNTDYIIGSQSTIAGGVLDGHIDSNRIVWMGHSTGGEGVVRAYTRVREGLVTPTNFSAGDIVLISSICPVAWLSITEVNPYDVNYHMFAGGADTDTSGAPILGYQQSKAIYERGTGNKQLIYVQGAGHGNFHAGGGNPWASGPDLIGEPAVHAVVKGYYLPLVELYTRGNTAGKDFFTRMYEGIHPAGIPANVVVANEYRDAVAVGNFVIDDYQTQAALSVSSSGGDVTYGVQNTAEVLMQDHNGSFDWDGNQPSNGMTRYQFPGDDPRCVVFDWAPGSPTFYELAIIPSQRDFTNDEFLSFRACQGTRHPQTDALDAPLTFTVTVRDGTGVSSSIPIANYGSITRTYKRTGFGVGAGWQNEFNTVRVRLSDFAVNGNGLNLHDIEAVRFEFGGVFGSERGRIGLDDIELSGTVAGAPSVPTLSPLALAVLALLILVAVVKVLRYRQQNTAE